ncbi:MAG TPA: lipopolysaccharide biosynthesis protein [Pyrinomonadaceae bacterium]|jgi:O-antigen/teichoic acid export membrane protein
MKVFNLALWDLFSRFANYFVTFFISIFLARILNPSEYGVFGIVLSVIAFSSIFLDFGFRSALIQAEEISQKQLSTVFFINLLLGGLLTTTLVFSSSYIERFYEIEHLALYLSGISLIFILNGLLIVPSALLQRELRIRQTSTINLAAAALSGVVAVVLALYDFKVWSLIVSQLSGVVFILTGYFIVLRWRPSFELSLDSVKPLWSFGSKMFYSGMLDGFFTRLDVFIIAKLFDVVTLGFYNRAQSLDQMVRMFSASTIVSVMFPVFSKHQSDVPKLIDYYERALHLISFAAFAVIGSLMLTATDIVVIMFTEKWLPVANYFRFMVFIGFIYPLSALMVNLISARGNSKGFLKLEIYKKILLVPAYLTFFAGGIYTFLAALGVVYIISLGLNMYYVKKEISVPLGAQIFAVSKYLSFAGVAFTGAFLLTNSLVNKFYLHIFVSCAVFQIIYLFINFIFYTPGFTEVADRVRFFINDKRNSDISAAS